MGGWETEDKSMQTEDKNKREEVKSKRGTPWKVLSRNPQSKHDNAITKLEKIGVPEEPKDIDTFLEGTRSGYEDHQTRDRGKEGRFVIEWMEEGYK